MSEYVPKISQMPGTELTADVVLARTMEKRGHIKAVAVVIQWGDGSMDCDWSGMYVSELCMMHKVLGITIDNLLAGED